ncbi:MAG: hypothetical protein ACK5KP_02475 [Paludibacteraceae bacterium]
MKKIILIASVLLIGINGLCAQKWESYFQLSVGTGFFNDANINATPQIIYRLYIS